MAIGGHRSILLSHCASHGGCCGVHLFYCGDAEGGYHGTIGIDRGLPCLVLNAMDGRLSVVCVDLTTGSGHHGALVIHPNIVVGYSYVFLLSCCSTMVLLVVVEVFIFIVVFATSSNVLFILGLVLPNIPFYPMKLLLMCCLLMLMVLGIIVLVSIFLMLLVIVVVPSCSFLWKQWYS